MNLGAGRSCFPSAHCGVEKKSRPAGGASAGAVTAGRVAQNIACTVGTRRASLLCGIAHGASNVPVVQRSVDMLRRRAAWAYRFLVGEMAQRAGTSRASQSVLMCYCCRQSFPNRHLGCSWSSQGSCLRVGTWRSMALVLPRIWSVATQLPWKKSSQAGRWVGWQDRIAGQLPTCGVLGATTHLL